MKSPVIDRRALSWSSRLARWRSRRQTSRWLSGGRRWASAAREPAYLRAGQHTRTQGGRVTSRSPQVRGRRTSGRASFQSMDPELRPRLGPIGRFPWCSRRPARERLLSGAGDAFATGSRQFDWPAVRAPGPRRSKPAPSKRLFRQSHRLAGNICMERRVCAIGSQRGADLLALCFRAGSKLVGAHLA